MSTERVRLRVDSKYHSGLSDPVKGLEGVNSFSVRDSVAFVWDVLKGKLPEIYSKCDVFYSDLAWKAGFERFNERAGVKDQRSFAQYMEAVSRVIMEARAPSVIVTGKHAERYLPRYYQVIHSTLNGLPCMAYQNRIERFGVSVEDLAKQAGTSAIHIRNRMKLLKLIPEIQKLVRNGHILYGYAQILADFELDPNYQIQAFSKFRDNPKPTTGWFRSMVSELKVKQSQGDLFRGPLFDEIPRQGADARGPSEPPHPETTIPPRIGEDLREIIRNQKEFWEGAAKEWECLGRPYKRNECKSAAQALNLVIL